MEARLRQRPSANSRVVTPLGSWSPGRPAFRSAPDAHRLSGTSLQGAGLFSWGPRTVRSGHPGGPCAHGPGTPSFPHPQHVQGGARSWHSPARLAPGELMGMEGATRGSERRDRGQSINPHAPLSVRAPWPQGCGDFGRDGLPIKVHFINQKHKLRVAMRNVGCNLSSLPQYVSRSAARFPLTARF